ncbi:hypothetical protein FNV43_RR07141 [Rhamnella rubrinervis]|uniref:Uncharacterized protein n=1 Tax=Rhamnella rubrinervis TaxID=2594499 RepID=A0A8K0HE80_9ROSA|nr:hypothetical protein FNV43_RR07141 [Rhamnella rubrinervis]
MAVTLLHHYYSSTSTPALAPLSVTKFRSSSNRMAYSAPLSGFRYSSVQNQKVSTAVAEEKAEIWKSIEEWMKDNILPILKPIEKSWQPQELLPNPDSDGFYGQLRELRSRAIETPICSGILRMLPRELGCIRQWTMLKFWSICWVNGR